MADTGAHTRENGVNHRKRRETLSGGESAPKKIKLEDDTPPEACPPSRVLPYKSLSELTRVAEASSDASAAVIRGGLRNLHEMLETVYGGGEITGARHEFMEREVVVEALRALRVERGDLYKVATAADFHAVERVLGIKYRRVRTHYRERCQPPSHPGRSKNFEIGGLANKFIIWSRKKGKSFEQCSKRETCAAVLCGNYDVYRLRYDDKLQREVARQLELANVGMKARGILTAKCELNTRCII